MGLSSDARRHLDRAIELQPNNVVYRLYSAWGMVQERRCEEAVAAFERLPLKPADEAEMAVALECAGSTEKAVRRGEDLVRRNPDPAWLSMGWGALALIRARHADPKGAEDAIRRAIAAETRASHFHHTSYLIACALAVLGRNDDAIQWLERTASEGLPCLRLFLTDPNLARLRGDARFRRLAARLATEQSELAAIIR